MSSLAVAKIARLAVQSAPKSRPISICPTTSRSPLSDAGASRSFRPRRRPPSMSGRSTARSPASPSAWSIRCAPTVARYPRFADALPQARFAELAPGDALYIPALWWHHVAALEPINILVNYWHNDHLRGGPFVGFIHALWAIAISRTRKGGHGRRGSITSYSVTRPGTRRTICRRTHAPSTASRASNATR